MSLHAIRLTRLQVALLALAAVVIVMMVFPEIVFAQRAPDVNPRLDFPGSGILKILLAVVLGVILLVLVGVFFAAVVKLGTSVLGSREGGAGSAGIAMGVSLFCIVIVVAGTSFLNRWIGFLS